MTQARRPFYTEYAWAYDLLIDRPVRKECATIVDWLTHRRILPGAALLDAGCGTGRYASELARRGYLVRGIDRSPELIAEARRASGTGPPFLSFAEGDLSELPAAGYDAILCRGVLNDVLEDRGRERAFAGFARSVRSSGALIFDVREWDATAARKIREPVFKKSVATEHGTLTFVSVTELDREHRRLVVNERHTLEQDHRTRLAESAFVMRCWTRDELDSILARHGFKDAVYFGAYDAAIAAGTTDRLVIVAQRAARD